MAYREDLIEKIQNADKWPKFNRPDFLSELNSVADEAFRKQTIEGYLASVLIYHQLCEEMIKVLLKCSQFYIRLAIFPAEITFKHSKKKMFGQLLDGLESGITFNKKKQFVSKCKKLNNIRIQIVHKLTLKNSVLDVKRQAKKIKTIHDEIYELYEAIYDEYRVNFHSHKKDTDWDDYLTGD